MGNKLKVKKQGASVAKMRNPNFQEKKFTKIRHLPSKFWGSIIPNDDKDIFKRI